MLASFYDLQKTFAVSYKDLRILKIISTHQLLLTSTPTYFPNLNATWNWLLGFVKPKQGKRHIVQVSAAIRMAEQFEI